MTGVRSRQEKTIAAIGHIVMIISTILALAPFWLLVSSSIQSETSIVRDGYSFWPKEISWASYRYLISEWKQIGRAYLVTIATTAAGTALSLFLVSMTSYVLSIKDLPGRTIIFIAILLTMLINGGQVSMYITYTRIVDVRDSILALLVPNLLLNGFNVMLVRNYVSNSIPGELQEAASIDGASLFSVYIKIIVPLSKPILATVGLLTALGYWNDWINGLYFISNAKWYSIQLLLNQINSSAQFLASHSDQALQQIEIPSVSIRMAISVMVIVPIVIAYPFFQKYFTGGMMVGAVKG